MVKGTGRAKILKRLKRVYRNLRKTSPLIPQSPWTARSPINYRDSYQIPQSLSPLPQIDTRRRLILIPAPPPPRVLAQLPLTSINSSRPTEILGESSPSRNRESPSPIHRWLLFPESAITASRLHAETRWTHKDASWWFPIVLSLPLECIERCNWKTTRFWGKIPLWQGGKKLWHLSTRDDFPLTPKTTSWHSSKSLGGLLCPYRVAEETVPPSWLLIGPLSNNYSINPIRHHYRGSLASLVPPLLRKTRLSRLLL